jgi:hypothetical protein
VRVEVEGGAAHVYRMPQTRAEYNALREQRSQLSEQLTSAASRRRNLAEQLDNMPEGPARQGIEARIALLDQRILRIEADIDATGQLITHAPATALIPPPEPRVFNGALSEDSAVFLIGFFTLLVLMPLAIGFARLMFRRAKVPVQAPGALESAARLERIEQAVDAIAIEVERISEGQRFTTRLLADSQGIRGLGVGQAAAEAIPLHEAEPARMRDAR